jgi:hypothetical protein
MTSVLSIVAAQEAANLLKKAVAIDKFLLKV